MNTRTFIADMESRGIRLYLEENRLRCQAAAGALTPDLRQRLAACKPEIIRFLSESRTDETLIAQFERQVAETPGALVFDDEQRPLTYLCLNMLANSWAGKLLDSGIQPEDRVGLLLRPGAEALCAVLAVFKAGAICVFMDRDDPRASARSVDSVSVFLTTADLTEQLPGLTLHIVDLDLTGQTVGSCQNPEVATSGKLAYLLPSSSGPLPCSGDALVRRLDWLQVHLPLLATDRVLLHTSLSTEMGIVEMLHPLLHGAALVMAGQPQAASASLIYLDSNRLETLSLGTGDTCTRRVVCCGAPPSEVAIKAFKARCQDELFYFYSVFQAGGEILLQSYPNGEPRDLLAGKPLWLLDTFMKPVPMEVAGEIYIGVTSCMEGVAGFVENPIAGHEGKYLYKSGDRARRRAAGYLDWQGPTERSIQRDGYRFHAVEPETSLMANTQLAACRIVVRAAELVAYVVPRVRFNEADLREFAASRLPIGQQPTVYIPVSGLPLTPRGAVDDEVLTKMVAIDENLASRLQTLLAATHGVTAAVVAVRAKTQPIPPLHVSRLLEAKTPMEPEQKTNSPKPVEAVAVDGQLAVLVGEPLVYPPHPPMTLADCLERAAGLFPQTEIVALRSAHDQLATTYADLWNESRRILTGLRGLNLQVGDKVLLQLPEPLDFCAGFWACVLGGFVVIPASVAPDYSQPSGALNLLNNARDLLGYPMILSDSAHTDSLLASHQPQPELLRVVSIDRLRQCEVDPVRHTPKVDDVALMLLTSGSTGKPKAVQHDHRTLLDWIAATVQRFQFTDRDITLNWMPLDHVGALVLCHLRNVYAGSRQVHAPMTPILQNPLLLLDYFDRYRANTCWMPNFAFGLINDAADHINAGSWDLSEMTLMVNAGEAVVPKTARDFIKLLLPHGLPANSMCPAWGMSETCSGATWAEGYSLESSADNDPYVFVGWPPPGCSIRIADEKNVPVNVGQPGRLQVKSPYITVGYYQQSELFAECMTGDGWFDTGDRGLIENGSLAITGREKDSIIINGVNYHGFEIEAAVEQLTHITISFTAACAVREPGANTDSLAIFFHTSLAADQQAVLLRRIREHVIEKVGVSPRFLLPVSQDFIPKTNIGKIQRSQLVKRFEQGELQQLLEKVDLLEENSNTLPNWFYRTVWVAREAEKGPVKSGHVLIFADNTDLGQRLQEELVAAGRICVCLFAGSDYAALESGDFRIDPTRPEHYRSAFTVLAERGDLPEQILHLWTHATGTETTDMRSAQIPGLFSLVYLQQVFARMEQLSLGLFVVTRSARKVLPDDKICLDAATLPGFVKTMAQEQPGLDVRLLDLDGRNDVVDLARELNCPYDEEIAYRMGVRHIQRLCRVSFPDKKQPCPFTPGEYYVISGGLGGLGQHVARFLLDNYEPRLLLLGRSADPDAQVLASLKKGPGQVIYEAVDITDKIALEAVLSRIAQRWGDPQGVLHLAGSYNERALLHENPDSFWAGISAKVQGTLNLTDLIDKPRFFLSFSSLLGFFGGRGTAAYAAANSFLAQHAEVLRDRGISATCLDWGIWRDIGLGRDNKSMDLLREHGYYNFSAQQGLLSLRAALHLGMPRLMVGLDGSKSVVRHQLTTSQHELRELAAFYTSASTDIQRPSLVDRFRQACEYSFYRVDEMPLTAAGDINLPKLLADVSRNSSGKAVRVAPRNETERRLVAIWLDLLTASEVSVEDNFFQLGGHSLLATQVISRITDDFGVSLTVGDLFRTPTVAGLASQLDGGQCAQETLPLVPIARLDEMPLSFAQQRLWFLDRLEGGAGGYNIPFALRIEGHFKHGLLEAALIEIVQRHESLRTTFAEREGVPYQVITDGAGFQVDDLDLTAEPDPEARVLELSRKEAGHRFDLNCGPLLRVRLARLAECDHLLLITMHHIISDGWSAGVLVDELVTLYRAFSQQKPSPLLPLPVQYADFAAWQHGRAAEINRQLAYWKTRLEGMPQRLDLPADKPRPTNQTFRAKVETLALGEALTRGLEELARNRDATLFMVLLASFQVLLSRFSGQRDFAIGSPIANRTRRELEPMIGFFVNTLVLRTDLVGNPSVSTLIDRVKQTTLDAYAHQEAPFEQVVATLQTNRDLSHTPLFQTMLVLQNAPAGKEVLSDLMVRPVRREISATQFDMTLRLNRLSDGVSGVLEYRADLFEPATVKTVLGALTTLLEALVRDPEQTVDRLDLVAPSHKQQMLEQWNRTEVAMIEQPLLHELFTRQLSRVADCVAVSFQATDCPVEQLSYAHLDRRANQLAAVLVAQGVTPEQPVGVCMERSLDLMVGLLAILRVGAIYVPLEPGIPKQRLTWLLEDCHMELAVTQAKYAPLLQELDIRPVFPDESATTKFQAGSVDPGQAAYLIFTSGSTGRPKGVTIAHRSIVNRISWIIRFLGLNGRDRVLQRTPLGFDASVWELFTPLATGGALVLAEHERHGDVGYLIRLIGKQRLTVAQMVPSLFAELLEHPNVSDMAALRYLCCGGEAYPLQSFKRFSGLGLTTRLVNLYGPTEVSIDATARLLANEVLPVLPIGKAIDNMCCYVLDTLMAPVPVGFPGELFIAGIGLARGYWQRPAWTAERFIPNPFAQDPGQRLYRSGDRVRCSVEGDLVFLGRVDHQIKLRGFRIEVGEIEAVLEEWGNVSRSLVCLAEAPNGEQQLVAYLLIRAERELDRDGLSHYLRERLPTYMVPSTFLSLDTWPRLASGKLDRAALAELSIPNERKEPLQEPRDVTELRLMQIWEGLLGRTDMSITDDFFQMGGHSLLSVRLMAIIQREFGRELALTTLFQDPTVAGLANALRKGVETGTWSPVVPMRKTGHGVPLFCVHPPAGTVTCYAALATSLGNVRPVYGLQAPGLEEGQQPLQSIEDYATLYLKTLQDQGFEGPYHILGWSAGGLIAYEMARQLAEQERQAGLLSLVDTGVISLMQDNKDASEDHLLYQLWARDLGISLETLQQYERPLELILEKAIAFGLVPPDYSLDQAQRRVDVSKAHTIASRAYVPKPFSGSITLYRAAQDEGLLELGDQLGWASYVHGEIQRIEIAARHHNILTSPCVGQLAAAIQRNLAQDSVKDDIL